MAVRWRPAGTRRAWPASLRRRAEHRECRPRKRPSRRLVIAIAVLQKACGTDEPVACAPPHTERHRVLPAGEGSVAHYCGLMAGGDRSGSGTAGGRRPPRKDRGRRRRRSPLQLVRFHPGRRPPALTRSVQRSQARIRSIDSWIWRFAALSGSAACSSSSVRMNARISPCGEQGPTGESMMYWVTADLNGRSVRNGRRRSLPRGASAPHRPRPRIH